MSIAASLAQIGEFSFILIVMGVDLELVPDAARSLVVAGAMLSILVNPALFVAIDRYRARMALTTPAPAPAGAGATAAVSPPGGSAAPPAP
jgi:CPA2 family monovalent cation:H+ antiporter-2